MSFDQPVDRRSVGATKWDLLASAIGVEAADALPMWVADMDFPPGEFLQRAVTGVRDGGFYGYFSTLPHFQQAVAGWMADRHGWQADPGHVIATHGLGNAIAMCLQTYTAPGDEIAILTPVYHEFAAKVRRNRREVRELPLAIGADRRFALDFERWEGMLSGRERMLVLSSPHNPAGRIWTPDEQRALADFCARHGLLLLCDEIHHDLVFPGERHVPFPVAVPDAMDRTVILGAASKTFNIAGARTGYAIIPDEGLRTRFAACVTALDIQPNRFGVEMTRAAYSPEGAAWVDALVDYLAGNARTFAEGVARIPGLAAMPMQSTYLAWVDFAPLGLSREELQKRVLGNARIGPSPGPPFGTGGELAMRFNLGTRRAHVDEAVARLQRAFADL
ncbi:putative aminotransferase [Oceanicola granulosus HTCC2516]|uniref:cysteine-S-conjugate beta-lyase n=1 Tax=Oceanicola granulosus (strain ATCC BAA-861 / DSM 15982 / KCTC 12143 / HTCC2516) TaxID=314256 RepID=Q2CCN2_OCEGH|nr:PatB family C-S lyase [Oceanicola granulosus]EAR50481.1 putative aminotransferase [Oceanicola granulosus HTCC2516]